VVRGYWAPLLSWLIAPLIYLGAPPHVSYQVVVGLAGFFWILLSVRLAKRVGVNHMGRLAIAAAMMVIILANGFSLITPDILGALFISLYFYWITHPALEGNPVRFGIMVGLSGALAYYAKYYNLPFVLAHIILVTALSILRRRQVRTVLTSSLVSIFILLMLISPWILAMSHRYGHITITTSGGITRAIVGPDANIHPCWDQQLCDQPADILYTWEDPQPQYYTAFGWSPFDSLRHFRHQIQLVKSNLWEWTLETMFRLGSILPLSFFGTGIMALIFWSDSKRRSRCGWVFLTAALYASGYMFTYSAQFRYYFPVLPILIIVGYLLVQRIFERAREGLPKEKTVWLHSFMVIVFIVSVLGLGELDLIVYFLSTKHEPCKKEAAAVVQDYLEAPIAGTDPVVNHFAYYNRVQTFGVLDPDLSEEEADIRLRELGVRTFISSNDLDLTGSFISKYFYDPILEVQICGDEYSVLRVPE